MPRFGWTSLACLLFVLTVLAALVRLGSPAAETRSLAAEIPRDTTASRTTAGVTTGNDGTPSAAAKAQETTGMARRIDDALSLLVDMQDDGTVDAAKERSPRPDAPDFPASRAEPSGSPGPTPPVFYRPSTKNALSGGKPGPVCGDLGRFPTSSRVVFPLERRYFYSYEDTWGAPRTQGGHEGTDLMVPAGTPEYALTDGTVVPVAGSNENGWNSLGGYAVMVRADYSIGPVEAGDLFYYAHLERRSPLKMGTRVRAGQVVGHAGDTGQGPEVTRGLFPPHLHLGWYDATGVRSGVESGAMNPYPLLEWIKANGGAVTGGSDARYCEAPSPPVPVPSTGEKDWPAPAAPGVRPDLDTGSNDPKPSPVARNDARARMAPAQKAAPAARAALPNRPAEIPRDRTRHEKSPPGVPVKTPQIERPRPPGPPKPATPGLNPPAPEPPAPQSPRPEPPKPGTPGPSASDDSAPPSRGLPALDLVGEDPRGESPIRPTLQQMLEGLIPNLDYDPADAENRERPGEDRRDEKHEEERDEENAKQERDDEPPANETESPPKPPAEQAPTEDEPSIIEPDTEDPDETDEPDPETTDPETTGPETTVMPETTDG